MSQEIGEVNKFQEAILELKLSNGDKIEVVLDTGFNGALFLPREFAEKNKMKLGIREVLQAAEDQFFEVDTATAEIIWLDKKTFIPVYISETGECLLGTELLKDSKLEIDYLESKVRITK